ncbi:MAG TPA: S1C family serine protease [Candidatus Tectomicrobia bacterium]|nr:S1C family serine protease [Candidatus Tectomicrobia bacterium]
MTPRLVTLALVALLVPVAAIARPVAREPRPHPERFDGVPSYVRRVRDALVGLHVRADARAASSRRLGAERHGTGIVFDPRGYAVTVSYVAMDARRIEARTASGRTVAAGLVAMDFEHGLAVVQLQEPGPWPAATLGAARDVDEGTLTGSVGLDEDGALVHATGRVRAVRRFAASWEYMLERALFVAPAIESWGGAALVDERGHVVGVLSLRLGGPPHVNLAIPVDGFAAVKDELIAAGRVVSRRPRPWLGLLTSAEDGAVVVQGVHEGGPAAGAGFRPGDRIVRVNGEAVTSQEHFYRALWRGRAGDTVEIAVRRAGREELIRVRSVDRHDLHAPRP